uniref:Uncharacterized protein n=1 Tax=Oryza meridionalis TaxID=40149 RepID=A0A0E0DTW0_9ORYZ
MAVPAWPPLRYRRARRGQAIPELLLAISSCTLQIGWNLALPLYPLVTRVHHGGYAALLASASPHAVATGGRSLELLCASARPSPSRPPPSWLGPAARAAPTPRLCLTR